MSAAGRFILTCNSVQPGLCVRTSSGLNTPFLWQPEGQSQSGPWLWGSVNRAKTSSEAAAASREQNNYLFCVCIYMRGSECLRQCTLFSDRIKCRTSPCFIYGRTTRGSPSLGSIMPSRDRMLGWWKPFIMRPSLRNWSTSPRSVIPMDRKEEWHRWIWWEQAQITPTS